MEMMWLAMAFRMVWLEMPFGEKGITKRQKMSALSESILCTRQPEYTIQPSHIWVLPQYMPQLTL